jgi:hypothetical protein
MQVEIKLIVFLVKERQKIMILWKSEDLVLFAVADIKMRKKEFFKFKAIPGTPAVNGLLYVLNCPQARQFM